MRWEWGRRSKLCLSSCRIIHSQILLLSLCLQLLWCNGRRRFRFVLDSRSSMLLLLLLMMMIDWHDCNRNTQMVNWKCSCITVPTPRSKSSPSRISVNTTWLWFLTRVWNPSIASKRKVGLALVGPSRQTVSSTASTITGSSLMKLTASSNGPPASPRPALPWRLHSNGVFQELPCKIELVNSFHSFDFYSSDHSPVISASNVLARNFNGWQINMVVVLSVPIRMWYSTRLWMKLLTAHRGFNHISVFNKEILNPSKLQVID